MSAVGLSKNLRDPAAVAAHLADRFRSAAYVRTSEYPAEELRAITEAGLLGLALPNYLGGFGVGREPGCRAALLPVLSEVGRGNLPLGRIFEGHVNALLLVQEFGFREQIESAADAVLQDNSVFGVWNTGPGGSPILKPLKHGAYQLLGKKTFATGAARIQKAIVTAALPHGGWQMCLVPLGEGGIQVHSGSWSPLGMEASESFSVDFSLRLPPDALIGKPGDYYVEPTFTTGAFRFCAVQLGGAQALFDSCREFVRTAGRHDDPLQLQRLGQMAVLLESGRQWLLQAGEWLEGCYTDARHLTAEAHMMRIATEEICTRVIQLVQVSVGARGLSHSDPFARTLRDLQMYLRQAGFDAAFQEVGRHTFRERPAHA